jgi:hypothetical protein
MSGESETSITNVLDPVAPLSEVAATVTVNVPVGVEEVVAATL